LSSLTENQMQAKQFGFWLSCLVSGCLASLLSIAIRELLISSVRDFRILVPQRWCTTLLGDHRFSGIVCSSTLVAQPREWYAVVKFNNGKGSKICGFVGQHFPLVLQRLLRCLAIAPVVLLFRCVALGIASSLWPLFLVVGLSRVCADSSR